MCKDDETLPDRRMDKSTSYNVAQLKVRFSFFRNFTYIIVDKASQQAAVIDPAWEVDTVVAALDQLQARLTTILLTHSHFDHVNIAEPLVRLFDSKVYMSAKEIDYYKFHCPNLNALQLHDTVDVGKTRFRCLFTPGHTAGSLSYLLSDSLFTGDTVFIEGCGVCIGEGSSADQLFDSIQEIKTTVHPDVRVFPGHSFGREPGYPLSHLMKENIYFLIQKRANFIDFRMRKCFTRFFDFH